MPERAVGARAQDARGGGRVMDTARLARAVHLTAQRVARGRYVVTGGAGAHVVTVTESGAACDCADFSIRGGPCKHIVACRLRRGDPSMLAALRDLVPMPRRQRRGPQAPRAAA